MKNIIKKLFFLLTTEQRILSLIVLGLTCIGAMLECVGVSIIVPFVNILLSPQTLDSLGIMQLIPGFLDMNYSSKMWFFSLSIVLVYVLKNLFFVALSWLRVKFSCKVRREISIEAMRCYMSRGYSFFVDTTFGELRRGIELDTQNMYQVLYSLLRIITDVLVIILIGIFIIISDFRMAFILFSFCGITIIFIRLIFGRQVHQAGIDMKDEDARVNQTLAQLVSGIKEILLLKKEYYYLDLFKIHKIKFQKAQCIQTVGVEIPAYIIEGICVAVMIVTLACRIQFGGSGNDLVAIIASFAIGAFRILPALGRISSELNMLNSSIPGFESVYENISAIRKVETSSVVDIASDSEVFTFNDELRIENVSFRYNSDQPFILDHANLIIHPGESIGIVGKSGAGKSTFVDILLGLLVPLGGYISIDGKVRRGITESWGRLVAYVPQEIFLEDGTIKSNVAFGENESDIDEDKVLEALKKADLIQHVESLPDGIMTYVGDRGIKLSGGQRQRIAIARALYRDPQILVLDEATSALDNDTEQAIIDAVNALQGSITMIIIAHRLTTVKKCDKVYEIHNGKMYESKNL